MCSVLHQSDALGAQLGPGRVVAGIGIVPHREPAGGVRVLDYPCHRVDTRLWCRPPSRAASRPFSRYPETG